VDLLEPVDDSAWDRYFDELEAAAHRLDGDVRAGRSPGGIDVRPPAGDLPMRLNARSQQILAMLDEVMVRAQAHRDQLAAELKALPRGQQVNRSHQTSLGGSLDIMG
jgi:hypothetical protein